MHVLVIPSWYRSDTSPQSGSFFREQAIALAKAGCTVSLLYWYSDAKDKAYFEELDDEGVRTILVHYKHSPYHINFLLQRHYVMEAFRKFFKESPPDIIHVHSFMATSYARLLSRKYRIPYIVTEHSSAFARNLLTRRKKWIARRGFRDARRVIAVSDGLKARIAPYCSREPLVIPNMVSDSFFQQETEEKTDCGSAQTAPPFRFLSVGYLNRHKGMDLLIAAFAQLKKNDPHSELVICGDGPEKESLKKQAADEGVASCVTFTGNLSRQDVCRQMQQAQAFVLPSRFETFGIVFIEALACGKPVIMTATDASKTIVNEKNGFVVPLEDIPALTESMQSLIDHYDRYDPGVIREDCRRRFSQQAVCQQIMAVYQEVLQNPRR